MTSSLKNIIHKRDRKITNIIWENLWIINSVYFFFLLRKYNFILFSMQIFRNTISLFPEHDSNIVFTECIIIVFFNLHFFWESKKLCFALFQ